MVITLNEDNEAIVSLHEGGVIKEKCIHTDDLSAILAKQHTMNTGILPPNTRYFQGNNTNYIIAIEAPAKMRRFLLHSNTQQREMGDKYKPKQLNIPFPHCLFTFKISNKILSDTWVHCLESRLLSPNDILKTFPFGNVYDNGSVCWGQIAYNDINSPIDLIAKISMFFDAPFNGDLTDRSTFNKKDGLNNFWELVDYLKDKEKFPTNLLKNYKTFQQHIKSLGGC